MAPTPQQSQPQQPQPQAQSQPQPQQPPPAAGKERPPQQRPVIDFPPPNAPTSTIPPHHLELVRHLSGLLDRTVRVESEVEQLEILARIRKIDQYYNGNQYIIPYLSGNSFDFIPIGSSTYTQLASGIDPTNSTARERQDRIINVVKGDCHKFVAVLGHRMPNVRASASDPTSEAGLSMARKINNQLAKLRAQWNVQRELQPTLALNAYKSGTTFFYTPYFIDAERWGQTTVPVVEDVPAEITPARIECVNCGASLPTTNEAPPPAPNEPCPNCNTMGHLVKFPAEVGPVPTITGNVTYPNGGVDCRLETCATVTTQYTAKSVEDLMWLKYEKEVHHAELVDIFPSLAQYIQSSPSSGTSSATSAYGKMTRALQASPIGNMYPAKMNHSLLTRVWIRPQMFNLLLNQSMPSINGAPGPLVGEYLRNTFPKGACITLVDNHPIRIEERILTHEWTMAKAALSEYIYSTPVAWDYLQIQDLINDMYNCFEETVQRNIPFTVADPTVLDPDRMERQPPSPGEFIWAKPGAGNRLGDAIYNVKTASIEPGVWSWVDAIKSQGRENMGLSPAIWGANDPDPTARGAEIRRNASLQQLYIIWNGMCAGWQTAYLNGLRQLCTHSEDPDLQSLFDQDGRPLGWNLEISEAIPMTWAERRDFFLFIIEMGPQVWDMLGITHPSNLAQLQAVMGLDGWTTPNLNARDSAVDIIQQLLQAAPIPQPPQPAQLGVPPGPPQMQPTIPFDPMLLDPQLAMTIIREWLLSEDGRKARNDPNMQNGYANVMAYVQQIWNILNPPPPPPQPGGPGGGPDQPGNSSQNQPGTDSSQKGATKGATGAGGPAGGGRIPAPAQALPGADEQAIMGGGSGPGGMVQ